MYVHTKSPSSDKKNHFSDFRPMPDNKNQVLIYFKNKTKQSDLFEIEGSLSLVPPNGGNSPLTVRISTMCDN